MTTILRTQSVSRFTCLGDRCEDTCCQNWSMQVDDATLALYRKEAPELLDVVEPSPDAPAIMRKNPNTGFCVRLEGGLCGIHKQYGAKFLGDACYFYPRVTRRLGEQVVQTATLSCPEIARLTLLQDHGCELVPADAERLPHSLKNYLPEGESAEDALAIHRAFVQAAGDPSVSAVQALLRMNSASRSLERIDRKSWRAM